MWRVPGSGLADTAAWSCDRSDLYNRTLTTQNLFDPRPKTTRRTHTFYHQTAQIATSKFVSPQPVDATPLGSPLPLADTLRPNRAVHRLAVMGFVRTTCCRAGSMARDWFGAAGNVHTGHTSK